MSVVWLQDGRGPDATSMPSLAEEEKEKNHADSAFCSAIFPSCGRPLGPQPAGGETVDGLGRPPVTTTAPRSVGGTQRGLVNHYSHFHPAHREREGAHGLEAKIVLAPLPG